jgi:putative FmdB family regulatory protein
MPTYVYKCTDKDCEHEFEVFQSIKADAIEKCEKCGEKVRKVFGATAIIFKGSGFYVNDYKKQDKYKSNSQSNSTEKSASETSNNTNSSTVEKKGDDKIKAS